MHILNLLGCWTAPMTTEDRPPVIAGHRMVKIDSHRVLMFGGRGVEGLSKILWLLDLDDRVSQSLSPSLSLPFSCFSLSLFLSLSHYLDYICCSSHSFLPDVEEGR